MRGVGRVGCAVALAAGVAGCAPVTRYRQTLLTLPAQPPASVGAPLPKGQVAGGGWVAAYTGIEPLAAEKGDPGVLVPVGDFGVEARVGIVKDVELGASFERAGEEGSRRSAVGVLPLSGRKNAVGYGVHATIGHTGRNGWGFGGRVDVGVAELPWTLYEIDDPDRVGGWDAGNGAELYHVAGHGTVRPVTVRWTHGVSYAGPVADGAFGFALAPQITNQGFTNREPDVTSVGPISFIPTAQLGVKLAELHLGGQVWWASSTDATTNGAYSGLGGRITLEVRIDVSHDGAP